MKILHIASLHNIATNGVGIAVSQHVKAQQNYADVALINIAAKAVPDIKKQIAYSDDFAWNHLEKEGFIPNIVIFHEIYHIEFCKLANLFRRKQIPYIVVPHGSATHTSQSVKKLKKTIGNFLLFHRYLKYAAAIQFLSQQELAHSLPQYQPKGFVGANGVALVEEPKTCFSDRGVKALFVGRLDPFIKGLDLLMEAMEHQKHLLSEHGFHLDIYGPAFRTWHEDLNAHIRKAALTDMVFVHDAIVGSDKADALHKADIFIQTSRTEGLPMGILEALSYGIPCLVTRGTTLGEIIEQYDAGWVADNNAESIAEKLEQAIHQRDQWQLKSRNAQRLIHENYAWDQVAKALVERYCAVIT